jgi:hypothetical protein
VTVGQRKNPGLITKIVINVTIGAAQVALNTIIAKESGCINPERDANTSALKRYEIELKKDYIMLEMP